MGLAVRLARAEAKQQQQPARTLGCAFSLRARYLELSRWRASIIDGRRVEGCLDRAAAAADLVIGGQASAGQERATHHSNQPTAPQHPPISPPPNKSTSLSANTLERHLAPAKNSVQLRVIASNEAPSAKQRHSSRAASNSLQRGAFTTSRGEKERVVPRPCPGTKERARILRNAFR